MEKPPRFRYFPPRFLFRRAELLRCLEPGRRFLEVGAGDLTLTADLLGRFESGVAVELTPEVRDFHARLPAYDRDRLEVFVGDATTLELGGNFDAVVSCEVLEHIADDSSFLRFLHGQLRPGGQLLLSVPARMKYWNLHDEVVGHLRRYEKPRIESVLEDAGFECVSVMSYGFPFTVVLRLPRAILARRQSRKRSGWAVQDRTRESNHRQIPPALTASPVRFVTRPRLFSALAILSRPMNSYDLSDGYLVSAKASPHPVLAPP